MATQIIVPIQGYFLPLIRRRSVRETSSSQAFASSDISTVKPALARAVTDALVGTLIFIVLAAFAAAVAYLGRALGSEIGTVSIPIRISSDLVAGANLLLYLLFLYRTLRQVLSRA